MAGFGLFLLTVGFLMLLGGVCAALVRLTQHDTLEYDLAYLWEKYPPDLHAKIRKTFE